MYLHKLCTIYKQAKRKKTPINHNCFCRSRASEYRLPNRICSNRSRKSDSFSHDTRPESRFRCSTPKSGAGFRPRVSLAFKQWSERPTQLNWERRTSNSWIQLRNSDHFQNQMEFDIVSVLCWRVYRRNTTAKYAAGRRGEPADRPQTLPRGFGRSRSTMSGLQSTGAPPSGDNSSLPRGRYGELKRQTAIGLSASGGLGHVDTRPAKRTSSTVSMTSIGYRGDQSHRTTQYLTCSQKSQFTTLLMPFRYQTLSSDSFQQIP